MAPPRLTPIGLKVAGTAKALNKAFDRSLVDAGGSLPMWLVLTSVKSAAPGAQSAIAAEIGIEGATLTHHLNRMERAGLVTRTRDEHNRRIHRVELTAEGEGLFFHLLQTVQAFDRRLRAGFSASEVRQLRDLLSRLEANVAPESEVAS